MNERFKAEILEGLKSSPKTLPSKYFYDKIGDELFVKIMNSPEYYLTNCEFEILSQQAQDIKEAFDIKGETDLIELGAGDGTKTIELLKVLVGLPITYEPIDISINALEKLEKRVKKEVPGMEISPQQGEYFRVLEGLKDRTRKIILFLGSNLGNMSDERAAQFLRNLSATMDSGDLLFMGLDLKKSKDIVLPAYNDAQGFTRDFNLNLLRRINKELGADFQLENFEHQPEYNEETGFAKSFLVSLKDQEVNFSHGEGVSFSKGERIFMEVSRKYDDEILQNLLDGTGLKISKRFLDSKSYFCDYLLEKQ